MDALIEKARTMAASVHAEQRYGEQPYTVHLAAVVAVMTRFGVTDPALLAAGWMHDAVEDTALTRAAVVEALGERVAALVDAVTDGPGGNRATRKARPYRLIPQVPGAVVVKLADRIANVESAQASRPGLLAMYAREHGSFRRKLCQPGEAEEMWAHLDALLGGQ